MNPTMEASAEYFGTGSILDDFQWAKIMGGLALAFSYATGAKLVRVASITAFSHMLDLVRSA